ncbi:hypothetical protein [Actinoallomurus acaciae]|uniref:Uncharacterized protein n=1 Tax=Actinoallomurus acaciae TaxID=502577 RepID=A0ABV5Y9C0_9ACTN
MALLGHEFAHGVTARSPAPPVDAGPVMRRDRRMDHLIDLMRRRSSAG